MNRIHSIIAVATIAMLLLMLDGYATTTAGVGYEALLATRFSRTGESEANRIGLELAARSGYDPRARITLWQEMTSASKGGKPTEFLSSNPADASRVKHILDLLPTVMPLYFAAK